MRPTRPRRSDRTQRVAARWHNGATWNGALVWVTEWLGSKSSAVAAYDQIKLIITLLGTPPDHEIDKFRSQKAREYCRCTHSRL